MVIGWDVVFVLTEVQEPYAVVVLLEKDFVVVDLTQSKWAISSSASLSLSTVILTHFMLCVWLNDVTQCDVLQQHLTLVLPPEATSLYTQYILCVLCGKGFKSESVCVCLYLLRVNIIGFVTHKHPSNESLLRTRAKVSLTLSLSLSLSHTHTHTHTGRLSLF